MRVLTRLVLLAGVLILPACATTIPTGATDTSCQAFEPIRYSRKDTDETQRQVREHNAAWDALCKGGQ